MTETERVADFLAGGTGGEKVVMSERVYRSVTEERDQLRQKVRDLEETLGEYIESRERLERELAVLNRERLYGGFR